MAFKYKNYYVSYPGSVKIDAALPVDIRSVVADLDNLYGNTAQTDQTWKQAYNGLIVSVTETNEAYMCINSADPYKSESWKKISAPDLDISGRMVAVIEFDNNKYAKDDGTGDPWQPNPDAKPLPQSENLVVGETYLQLALNDDDYVYINSKELISLDDYYTKGEVDDKVGTLDSSVSAALDDIRNFVGETTEAINSSIDRIDESVLDLFNSVEDLTGVVEDLANDFADISARVDELKNNTVKSVKSLNDYVTVEPIVGDVLIDVSTKDAENTSKFPSSGFVTDGYVEERLDIFNWVEVENE